MSWPHWMWFILGLALCAASLYSSLGAWKWSFYSKNAGARKLFIHSAVYGTGPIDDDDVTEALRRITTNRLALNVTNEALGQLLGKTNYDPAPMKPKRLEVKYSYSRHERLTAVRTEGARIVLPVAEVLTIAEMPTYLILRYGAQGTQPIALDQKNIVRWYALMNFLRGGVDAKTKQPVEARTLNIFICFENPITFRQILIDSRGLSIPIHEVKDSSPRHAIVSFAGDLVGITLEIKAV